MEARTSFWDKLFMTADFDYKQLYKKVYNETITEACTRTEDDSSCQFYLENKKEIWEQERIERYIEKKYMFFGFYAVYLSFAERKILDKTKHNMSWSKEFQESICQNLYHRLVRQSIQVLIREIGVAKEKNMLPPTDSAEQYIYYEKEILQSDNYIEYLFGIYPEMFRVLEATTKSFCFYVEEVIENIFTNKEAIKKELSLKEFSYIKEIHTSQGDYHNKGRSVCDVVFDTGIHVIYKPRNIAADEGFQKLLKWFNDNVDDEQYIELKTLKQYVGNNFGVVEFVSHQYCENEEQLKEYYHRMGELLGILYLIDASDMHRENVIACGKHPVIVDCETLFTPYYTFGKEMYNEDSVDLYKKISTLQRIGILPFSIKGKNSAAQYGGLDHCAGKKSPFKAIKIYNVNTSDVKAVFEYEILTEEKNNPVELKNQLDEEMVYKKILNGFSLITQWILSNKQEFKNTVLQNFSHTKLRVLVKSTMLYDAVIQMSYHPDILTDEVSRNVILLRNFIQASSKECIGIAECQEMKYGDIPMFWVEFDKTDLLYSEGVVEDYFPTTARKRFEDKIETLNQEILDLQKKILRECLLGVEEIYDLDRTRWNYKNLENESLEASKEEMKTWLIEVAEYLSAKSICYGNGCRTWMERGFNEKENAFDPIMQLDYSLYLGSMGMALYYVEMFDTVGDSRYLTMAEEVVKMPMLEIDDLSDTINNYSIGAFSGFSGRLYVLSKLATRTKKDIYTIYIDKYLTLLNRCIFQDRNFDIIGGTAGLLMTLLSIKESGIVVNDNNLLEICIDNSVKHLLHTRHEKNGKTTWVQNIENGKKSYTGFAHGTMGILAALARYYKLYPTDEVLKTIESGLVWMNSMYDMSMKNWYKDSDRKMFAYGWCHGVSGILLGFSLIKKYCPNIDRLDKYIEVAKTVTVEKGFGNNITLCHGDLGNMEILRIYSKICHDEECQEFCDKGLVLAYKNVMLDRWKGRCFRGREIFGIMIGLAGFGHATMYGLNEKCVQSLLFLE